MGAVQGGRQTSLTFELHIRKKNVQGTFNDRPVTFTLDDVKKLGIAVDPAK